MKVVVGSFAGQVAVLAIVIGEEIVTVTPVPVIAETVIVASLKALVISHTIAALDLASSAVIGSEQVAVGADVGDVKVGVISITELVASLSEPLTEKVYLPLLHVPSAILDAMKVGSEKT